MDRKALIFVGLLVAAMAGCQTVGPAQRAQPRELLVSSDYPSADVPVPACFTMEDSPSYSASSPFVFQHFAYRAWDVPTEDVARFYEKQMPSRKWKYLGRVDRDSERVLVFLRDRGSCLIHVGTRWFGYVTTVKTEFVQDLGAAPGPVRRGK